MRSEEAVKRTASAIAKINRQGGNSRLGGSPRWATLNKSEMKSLTFLWKESRNETLWNKTDVMEAMSTHLPFPLPCSQFPKHACLRDLPFPAWTMSEMADNTVCEKFEANVFVKSRCQNCFRTVAAHQCGNQESKEHAAKSLDCVDGTSESSPCDPLCILVPQCELYVCVGSEDRTESWQESLEYTQLSCRAEEEASTCPDACSILGIDTDAHDTFGDWEMTRILGSILGPDKDNTMYYAGHKQEVRPENLHSDRPRWADMASSGRTESWSCPKAGSRAVSQDQGDSRRQNQAESGYFSLERRKSEPSGASSPPRVGSSVLPARGGASRPGGWLPSSITSADSDQSWRTGGSSEGRHGLMRQEYTVLADLPKPKRLSHRQAFEKERSSSRTRSPGRAEVERIFGQERRKASPSLKLEKRTEIFKLSCWDNLHPLSGSEFDNRSLNLPFCLTRRKSETLEAFQALEEGLLERLDSKTLKLAKEGRLVRRQSSPNLRREVMKRLPWEPEQPSRSRGEPQRFGRPEQRPERCSRSQGESVLSGSPIQRLQRESRSRGVFLHSVASHQQAERERWKHEDPRRTDREKAPLRTPASHGKPTEEGGKSQSELLCHKSSGKSTETKWRSSLGALHAAHPGRSLDKSRASHGRLLERYKDSDRKARGKPLLPIDTGEHPREEARACRGDVRDLSPGRTRAARGQGGQTLSPPRHREVSRRAQGEAGCAVSPGREMGIGLKTYGEARGVLGPGLCTGGSQREISRSLSPGRCRESSQNRPGEARRSPSPGRPVESCHACPKQARSYAVSEQQPEGSWKSQREACSRTPRASIDTDWPGKGEQSNTFTRKENDWKGCGKSLCPTSPPVSEQKRDPCCHVRPEDNWKSQEGSLCHGHPAQLLEREWMSQGECWHLAKPGRQQQQLESNCGSRRSSTGWIEDEWKNRGRCPSPAKPESQLENEWSNEEKLLYQPDLLNFKKGWMSILHEPGEWTKHWFVLTDSSLRYYRDSNAEEADELDGEIDLRSCTDVTEYAVQRNYGFQIHTKDGVFTLSAMTSGIRRNWIEALRKSIRPASVPDVTKLSDSNKENFRSYGSPKSSFRSEEQRPSTGSEVITRGGSSSRRADGQRHAFDYVELSPLQQGPLNQGSPQQTRGRSARAMDGVAKREELERDLALRSEERRKWFESSASGVLQTDGLPGDLCPKAGGQEPLGPPLSEAQRSRLSEEIEKKWQELERLPLKESKRVPLMALLNQGKGSHEDVSEALEKEVQVLRSQLESLRAQSEAKSPRDGHAPRGYISQEACEHSLAKMETSHQQVMTELQRHHQREMERLRQEKDRLLAEEAAATAAAIEALKKAHREELNKELGRTRSFQKGGSDPDVLRRQHQSDMESLKRELQVLSEQYSQKCLEIGNLVQKAEEQEQMLQHCQQEGKELLRQNQELQRRLSEEIGQLRSFIAAQGSREGASHNSERSSCELEVLLRVKENELQYLKQEVQCLKDELQMMQKDKTFASGKYQDVYVELNHIKRRSEREIEQLKEHLRLAMAALQEKEMLHNSIGK
ncbi:TRIO and F-actin-binding protein isoform X1 [Rhineura floridana]|uniref:TRIO and F-actin-binding protein isoform X1 n=1 Tax=Rhineura floridana TaxID=261503 RepID=UPI002AC88CD1|nr:TRIO and F-actin-binding protein isoform X1 [Rhineura floridana]